MLISLVKIATLKYYSTFHNKTACQIDIGCIIFVTSHLMKFQQVESQPILYDNLSTELVQVHYEVSLLLIYMLFFDRGRQLMVVGVSRLQARSTQKQLALASYNHSQEQVAKAVQSQPYFLKLTVFQSQFWSTPYSEIASLHVMYDKPQHQIVHRTLFLRSYHYQTLLKITTTVIRTMFNPYYEVYRYLQYKYTSSP